LLWWVLLGFPLCKIGSWHKILEEQP
jgi:hypothetical protein